MIRVILLAVVAGAIYYTYRRILALPPAQRRGLWWKLGLGGLVAISLVAVATGRMHWLGGALALLLAVARFGGHALFRLWPLLRASGKDAVFRTDYLEVRFVVRTSELQGSVLAGPYEGEQLHALTVDQLNELASFYQDRDRKSYYLTRVFLQRAGAARGTEQQHQQAGANEAFSSTPSRDEALMILGLSGNPSEKDIIDAHRRLIQKLHPDRGGNDYLAARVNRAKDTLLGRR